MECENCGCVPTDSVWSKTCQFCGSFYTELAPYVPTVIIPTPERARELRDLYTELMELMTTHPLRGSEGGKWDEIEKFIYFICRDESEWYDELANRDS